MRGFLPVVSGTLLLAPALLAQNDGINPATTRAMIEVSEMGRSTIKPESLAGSVAFQQGDGPTISAHPVTPHEPPPAARKAAEKAEHLAKRKQQEAEAHAGLRDERKW